MEQDRQSLDSFHAVLRGKVDDLVHSVYAASRNFPKEELYGATSQLRRAVLSIALNYIEGYARQKSLVMTNFYEISYGSLQEVKYLIGFSVKEKYLDEKKAVVLLGLSEEIGAMLWKTIEYRKRSRSA